MKKNGWTLDAQSQVLLKCQLKFIFGHVTDNKNLFPFSDNLFIFKTAENTNVETGTPPDKPLYSLTW